MRRSFPALAALLILLAASPPLLAAPPPDVPARAWVVLDVGDGTVLGARAPRDRVPMASLTKVMTARIAAADGLDRQIAVPAAALAVGESSAGLAAGERLSARRLTQMALVSSGNDAAVALALGTAPTQAAFVRRMNAEARRLGLRDTRYANPHGLDAEGHYSSALDSARLLAETLDDPDLRTILGEPRVATPVGALPSTNLLLGAYAGVDGGKTGMTDDAGWCTVVTATRAGERLVVAVLGAESESDRLTAARRLLDWGFSEFHTTTVLTADTAIVRVSTTPGGSVALRPATDVVVPVRGDQRPEVRLILPVVVRGPIAADSTIGLARISVAGRVFTTVPLVSASAVPAPEPVSLARRLLDRLLPT